MRENGLGSGFRGPLARILARYDLARIELLAIDAAIFRGGLKAL
jgi:hypothetical protein